jgi:hypothetical protein
MRIAFLKWLKTEFESMAEAEAPFYISAIPSSDLGVETHALVLGPIMSHTDKEFLALAVVYDSG